MFEIVINNEARAPVVCANEQTRMMLADDALNAMLWAAYHGVPEPVVCDGDCLDHTHMLIMQDDDPEETIAEVLMAWRDREPQCLLGVYEGERLNEDVDE